MCGLRGACPSCPGQAHLAHPMPLRAPQCHGASGCGCWTKRPESFTEPSTFRKSVSNPAQPRHILWGLYGGCELAMGMHTLTLPASGPGMSVWQIGGCFSRAPATMVSVIPLQVQAAPVPSALLPASSLLLWIIYKLILVSACLMLGCGLRHFVYYLPHP